MEIISPGPGERRRGKEAAPPWSVDGPRRGGGLMPLFARVVESAATVVSCMQFPAPLGARSFRPWALLLIVCCVWAVTPLSLATISRMHHAGLSLVLE
jgi:hypothetical protein